MRKVPFAFVLAVCGAGVEGVKAAPVKGALVQALTASTQCRTTVEEGEGNSPMYDEYDLSQCLLGQVQSFTVYTSATQKNCVPCRSHATPRC